MQRVRREVSRSATEIIHISAFKMIPLDIKAVVGRLNAIPLTITNFIALCFAAVGIFRYIAAAQTDCA